MSKYFKLNKMKPLQIDPQLADQLNHWASQIAVGTMLAPKDLPEAHKTLLELGWQPKKIGVSSAGQDIVALHWPGAGKKVVAYGYPHPDEPAGATALLALGQAIAGTKIPAVLQDMDWWFVLCADPDQAGHNQTWIEKPGLANYLHNHWRPIYQQLEVDYQFPINHPPFWQPRGLSLRGLTPPLPESLAIADLLDKVRPNLLGLMHGNHASGVYTFLSHRPGDSLIQAWDQGTALLGLQPHWGERPDPGKRWKTKRADILKERRLQDRRRNAEQRFGDLEGRRLVGCVSVAQYLESLDAAAVVITPEVGLWEPTGIGSTELVKETRKIRVEFKCGKKGWKEISYGTLRMPDGKTLEVCYSVLPAKGPGRSSTQTVALTVGMAGVEAVEYRRWFMSLADNIYNTAHLPDETIRLFERSKISVPGPRVNDQSMLIFRTHPGYQRVATQAQVADLRYRWGMQTSLWVGHGLQLYLEQNDKQSAKAQNQLLAQAQSNLLDGLPRMTSIKRQARSQISRLILTAAALPE